MRRGCYHRQDTVVSARPGGPDLVLTGKPGYGPIAEGRALVSQHGFSARYDLNRESGVFSRKEHDLFGESVVDVILIAPVSKGGIATSWMLREMVSRRVAPLGIILHSTNPVIVQGAILAGMPIMRGLLPPAHQVIQTGDWIRMNPERGIVEAWR